MRDAREPNHPPPPRNGRRSRQERLGLSVLLGGLVLGFAWTGASAGAVRLGLVPAARRAMQVHPWAVVFFMPYTILIVAVPVALVIGFRGRRQSIEDLTETHGWMCFNYRYRLDRTMPEGECPECGEPFDAGILKRGWCRTYRELAYQIDWPARVGAPA